MSFISETTPPFVTQVTDLPAEEVIFGLSKTMDTVRKNLQRIAGANVPIFLRSEAGAGKEIVARYIHHCYPGQHTSFIKAKLIFTQGADWRR
ncbi:MAG: sigma 54-interacting transcriptional regulator [Terriglobia bacterium]